MIFYREITPFINSIYEIQDLGLDLDPIRTRVEEQLQDKSLWFNRANGMQTHNITTLEDPAYIPIFDRITPVIQNIVSSWGVYREPKLQLYFTNVDKKGGFSHSHSHINCVLSGVVYITVPDKAGDIAFTRPDAQEYQFKMQNPTTPYTMNTFKVTPRENMALIFPSFIKHSVEVHNFAEGEKRISVAFDYTL